ncbi:MAG: hypothetical protein ACKOUT_05845 [Novosphingobium sp.]
MAVFDIGLANLVGIVIYLASALVAIATAIQTAKFVPDRRVFWIGVSGVFVGLAVFRLFGAEEVIRQALRGYLIEHMEYQERRIFQTSAVLVCLAVCGLGLVLTLPRLVRWPLWRLLAAGGIGMLALLYSLRIISLHGVDRILYAGVRPLHFNHLLELTAIAAIWYSAWLYRRHGSDPRRRRSGGPAPSRR